MKKKYNEEKNCNCSSNYMTEGMLFGMSFGMTLGMSLGSVLDDVSFSITKEVFEIMKFVISSIPLNDNSPI